MDYGLNITVELLSDPYLLDDTTARYLADISNTNTETESEHHSFVVGNVTFVTISRLNSGVKATYFYKYSVRGPSSLSDVSHSHRPNWTGEYLEAGRYQYTVDVIAKVNNIQAHHANATGQFWLLGEAPILTSAGLFVRFKLDPLIMG